MRRALLLAVAAALVQAPVGGAWTWPVDGPVLRPFLLGNDPYAAGQHRGVDIGATDGEDVRAPAAGSVSFAGTVPGGGKTVTIRTPDGYSVTVLHLGSLEIAKGTHVAEGQRVATAGVSGDPEWPQPYVHLGIRLTADPNGYLDPLLFLPARAASPPVEGPPAATPDVADAPIADPAVVPPSPAVVTTEVTAGGGIAPEEPSPATVSVETPVTLESDSAPTPPEPAREPVAAPLVQSTPATPAPAEAFAEPAETAIPAASEPVAMPVATAVRVDTAPAPATPDPVAASVVASPEPTAASASEPAAVPVDTSAVNTPPAAAESELVTAPAAAPLDEATTVAPAPSEPVAVPTAPAVPAEPTAASASEPAAVPVDTFAVNMPPAAAAAELETASVDTSLVEATTVAQAPSEPVPTPAAPPVPVDAAPAPGASDPAAVPVVIGAAPTDSAAIPVPSDERVVEVETPTPVLRAATPAQAAKKLDERAVGAEEPRERALSVTGVAAARPAANGGTVTAWDVEAVLASASPGRIVRIADASGRSGDAAAIPAVGVRTERPLVEAAHQRPSVRTPARSGEATFESRSVLPVALLAFGLVLVFVGAGRRRGGDQVRSRSAVPPPSTACPLAAISVRRTSRACSGTTRDPLEQLLRRPRPRPAPRTPFAARRGRRVAVAHRRRATAVV